MSQEELNELRFQKAISLVLCAECKHYPFQTMFADDKMYIDTYEHCYYMKSDDFCSKGELNDRK